MIDSHVHINSKILSNPDEEIKRINSNKDLEYVINIGMDIDTSTESINISNNNPKFYSSVGIHPLFTEHQNLNDLYNLVTPKTVAIGEIGLDSSKPNLEEQKRYLIKRIVIANELGLQVIIHSSNTNQEIIKIFKTIVKPIHGCVFHCFQPDLETIKYLIENNYYISFAGRITYPTAKKSIEVLKTIPKDLYLVETDAPYISPHPFRDEINHSENVSLIIKRISELLDKDYKEIENQTKENTLRLFKKIK